MLKEPSLFDYIGDISLDKKYLYDEYLNKNYSQYMINRGLGQHLDTVLLANEMNKRSPSDLLHHDFLFYSVERKKRYGKWTKADTSISQEAIDYVKNKYDVNQTIALQYIKLLEGDAEFEKLIKSNNKGGIIK